MKPKAIRTTVALFLVTGAGALFVGPLGCGLPEIPKAPEAPSLELPDAPAPPKPPQLPEAPKAPNAPVPPKGSGNCCMRTEALASRNCGGRASCCTPDLDRSECEDVGALWFSSAEGCMGAC